MFIDVWQVVDVGCGWCGESRFPAQSGCADVDGAARVSLVTSGCGDDAQ